MAKNSSERKNLVECPGCGSLIPDEKWFNTHMGDGYKTCPVCGNLRYICDGNKGYRSRRFSILESTETQILAKETKNIAKHLELKEDGYGRIYTDTRKNAKKIKKLIYKIDAEEAEYLPDDLIAVYDSNEVALAKTESFYDFDLYELYKRCVMDCIPFGYLDCNVQDDDGDKVCVNGYTSYALIDCLKMLLRTGAPVDQELQNVLEKLEPVVLDIKKDEEK